jgi:site-specific recombinase XerD
MSARAALRLVDTDASARVNGTVPHPPRKQKNAERRPREHLTETEVRAIAKAASKRGRHGHRDRTMILVCFTHGLRVQELVDLKWDQINLEEAFLTVHRVKNGKKPKPPATHPIPGDELRALRRLKREAEAGKCAGSPFVFITELGGPMTTNAFHRMLTRTAAAMGFPFPIHPHMLRHAAGYKMVNEHRPIRMIQDYLGHHQIESTEFYTKVAPGQFDGWFR